MRINQGPAYTDRAYHITRYQKVKRTMNRKVVTHFVFKEPKWMNRAKSLSPNRSLSPADDCTGKIKHRQIVALLLLPSHHQPFASDSTGHGIGCPENTLGTGQLFKRLKSHRIQSDRGKGCLCAHLYSAEQRLFISCLFCDLEGWQICA